MDATLSALKAAAYYGPPLRLWWDRLKVIRGTHALSRGWCTLVQWARQQSQLICYPWAVGGCCQRLLGALWGIIRDLSAPSGRRRSGFDSFSPSLTRKATLTGRKRAWGVEDATSNSMTRLPRLPACQTQAIRHNSQCQAISLWMENLIRFHPGVEPEAQKQTPPSAHALRDALPP
jgi:hypothetical protein